MADREAISRELVDIVAAFEAGRVLGLTITAISTDYECTSLHCTPNVAVTRALLEEQQEMLTAPADPDAGELLH